MITVRFYGDLIQYGRRFDLHADTPAEALRALLLQIPGLRGHIEKGLYQVRWKKQDQSEDGIQDTFKRPDTGVLHIVPRVAGAGKAGQVIAGALLVVAGVILSYTPAAAFAPYLIQAGLGLMLGGVAQMLTKQPKLNDTRSEVMASRNTAFSNLDNTTAQGQVMPLAYGICYCGSRVVSQGIETRRINAQTKANSSNPVVKNIEVKKTFVTGVAARAPNGQRYNTDFDNDSVRAQNYTASYI